MLSIHYVSIMMQIFYIDLQQHWECDRTINIGAYAHGERRYQQNSHKWQTWPSLTVGLPVTSERYWASFQVTWLFHKVTVSQCDHFLFLLFFCCHICICCLKLHQADNKIEELFCFRFGGGALSSNIFTICAVYWSLGRRGYFGVSNVALVLCVINLFESPNHCTTQSILSIISVINKPSMHNTVTRPFN